MDLLRKEPRLQAVMQEFAVSAVSGDAMSRHCDGLNVR